MPFSYAAAVKKPPKSTRKAPSRSKNARLSNLIKSKTKTESVVAGSAVVQSTSELLSILKETPKRHHQWQQKQPQQQTQQTRQLQPKKGKKQQQQQQHNNNNNQKEKKQVQPPQQHQQKSKKPKPSKGTQLGDVLVLSPKKQANKKHQQQQQAQGRKISTRKRAPQQAILTSKDFPSLLASVVTPNKPELPTASTRGKTPLSSRSATATTRRRENAKRPPSLNNANSVKKAVAKSNTVPKSKKNNAASKQQQKPSKQLASPPSSSLLLSFGAKQRTVEEESAFGKFLAPSEVSQIKKGRQRMAPQQKKFSVLKKKILAERLQKWKEKNAPTKKGDEDEGGDNNNKVANTKTVVLSKYAATDELQDEDEYEENLDNLREMASKIGETSDLFIHKRSGDAFVRFLSSFDAQAAQACWNELVIGGDKLDVELVDVPEQDQEKDWTSFCETYEKPSVQMNEGATAAVVLENILTEDDLGDPDCMEESLADIRSMAAACGTLQEISVLDACVVLQYIGPQKAVQHFDKRVIGGQVVTARLRNDDTDNSASTSQMIMEDVLTDEDLEDEDCMEESMTYLQELASKYGTVVEFTVKDKSIAVTYEGAKTSSEAAQKLCGHVLGGEALRVMVVKPTEEAKEYVLVLSNLLTEDDLEDEDCLEETKADIAELAGKTAPLLKVLADKDASTMRLHFKCDRQKAEEALHRFNGMVVGGETILAVLENEDSTLMEISSPVVEPITNVEEEEEEETKGELKPLYSGDKLIPERFAECKRVPKIPVSGPRAYASKLDDDTAKPLLIEMLGELMRLQKRAMEDKNAKSRRRLVMGLREVARGIRAHKVKMVVMANNLDEYGVIDEKLQEILDLAKQESVPIFFEFNKRGLGKAIGKSIKIGVIGVQNAEGAHQQFKKLMTLAHTHFII